MVKMENTKYNDLLKNNKLLSFFLKRGTPIKSKIVKVGVVFFTIPFLLLFLSSFHGTLFLNNQGYIGMMDDSLFLFAVVLAPLQLFILNVVLTKFISFLNELPSLSKNSNRDKINTIINKYKSYINKKRPRAIIVKVIVLSFYLYSNIKALYTREGGWNSSEHLLEFSLTIVFVLITFIVLIEILSHFILIIIAQIKLTTELTKNDLIEIEPLSLDKSGSLKSLGELSLSFTFILIPFIISAITHYLTWGVLTAGFISGLILLFSSTVFLFFFPLGTVHALMRNTKKEFLKEVDEIYIQLSSRLLDDIQNNKENIDHIKERSDIIKEIYEKGKSLPVWPFDLKILTKFTAILFGPIFLIIIEHFIQILIGKII
jgi:hypothetical protein